MAEEKEVHWRGGFDENYLGSQHVPKGKDLVLTISHVTQQKTATQEEKIKNIAHFVEPGYKPMILNAGNSKIVRKFAGFENNILKWKNIKVAIYVKSGVKAFGQVTDALRFRDSQPAVKIDIKPAIAVLNACKTQDELKKAFMGLAADVKGHPEVTKLKDSLKTTLPENAGTEGN